MMPEQKHIRSLDGLRGVAILLVIGFHYFHNAAPVDHVGLYPFGFKLNWIPLFRFGYLGVELFFMISGFVIAMTLENCKTPVEFIVRRFARIWPALVVCSIATYVVMRCSASPFAKFRPEKITNFFPSLTLTPTMAWDWAFPRVDLVDSVYWSLVVEMRFYIIAALIFWLFAKINFSRNLVVFACVFILLNVCIHKFYPEFGELYGAIAIPYNLPWFAAGAVFYDLYKLRFRKTTALFLLFTLFIIIAKTSMFDSPSGKHPLVVSIISLAFFIVFWLISHNSVAVKALASNWLVFVGVSSYSVYLLHNYIGMVVISSIPKGIGMPLAICCVLLVACAAIACGYLSYLYIEQPFRKLITRSLLSSGEVSCWQIKRRGSEIA